MNKSKRLKGVANPGQRPVDLPLEFEGKRAFAVWDRVRVGEMDVKARIEVDPKRLRKAGPGQDYLYEGLLILPRPQDN